MQYDIIKWDGEILVPFTRICVERDCAQESCIKYQLRINTNNYGIRKRVWIDVGDYIIRNELGYTWTIAAEEYNKYE